MPLRSLFATLALGVAASFNSAHAQAPDPCSVFICMAGLSGAGATGGPACAAPKTAFFAISIYDPSFDPGATSTARRVYLKTCPGASVATNVAILNAIIAEWGEVP